MQNRPGMIIFYADRTDKIRREAAVHEFAASQRFLGKRPTMGFQLSISAVDYGAARVIKLEGFLAQLEIYSFKRAVEQALNEGKWVIIADVERVNFIDSAGIASLIYMRKESIQRHAVSVLIAPPGSSVRKILDSTNLVNFMQIVATREEAFAVSMVRVGDMSQPCELPTQHDCADTQIQHKG